MIKLIVSLINEWKMTAKNLSNLMFLCFVYLFNPLLSQVNQNERDEVARQKLNDEFIIVIDGVILADSSELLVDSMKSITTLHSSHFEKNKVVQKYLKGKKGPVIFETKMSAKEEYIFGLVEDCCDHGKVPIAVNGELLLTHSEKLKYYSLISEDSITRIRFVNGRKASKKYNFPLIFGVLEIKVKI